MTSASRIEWTERTWNPTTGCTKISAGCTYCYAEVMARRLTRNRHLRLRGGFQSGAARRTAEPAAASPSTNCLFSQFHVRSFSQRRAGFVPLISCSTSFARRRSTTYQILTKRARRLPQYFARRECPKNAWLGVSVENKRSGVPRIAELVKVEAAVRFLSIEPLLEDVGAINLAGIHWVIVGGESGHQARRMQPSG